MKTILNAITPVIVILLIIFGFLLIWQKQQNEHTGRMVENAVNQAQQKQEPVIELVQVEEEKSLRERMKHGLKSAIAFVLSIFTKL